MEGPNCPKHNEPMQILSTLNEWKYYCPKCNRRYNAALELKPIVYK